MYSIVVQGHIIYNKIVWSQMNAVYFKMHREEACVCCCIISNIIILF